MEMKQRVRDYWTRRSHDFGTVRKNELENEMGQRWLREIEKFLPKGRSLNILDVGTGTGFFAVLLAQHFFPELPYIGSVAVASSE